MARPPLPIGTFGNITVTEVDGGFRARCRFRGNDGVVRSVERVAKSASMAKTALKVALQARTAASSLSVVNGETLVTTLLDKWWDNKRTLVHLARSTEASYSDVMARVIVPKVGSLRLREVSAGILQDFLLTQAKERASQAELARTILKQAFAYAVMHDAVLANPAAGTELPARAKPEPRALTIEELSRMREAVASMRQNRWLADIVEVQLGIAGRIGEVLSLKADDLDLDNEAGPRVHIQSTLISIASQSPFRQEHTKDGPEGQRTVTVPAFAADVLRRRAAQTTNADGYLFVSRNDTLLAPRNVRSSWRNIRSRFDLDFVTPHHLRKTSLTAIARVFDVQTASLFADHKDVTTTETHYIQELKEAAPDVRKALNTLAPTSPTPAPPES